MSKTRRVNLRARTPKPHGGRAGFPQKAGAFPRVPTQETRQPSEENNASGEIVLVGGETHFTYFEVCGDHVVRFRRRGRSRRQLFFCRSESGKSRLNFPILSTSGPQDYC
jgi:hypothetical protein